jgi:hypothetical protein
MAGSTPLPIKNVKVFQLDARNNPDEGGRQFKIRYHLRRETGLGPSGMSHVSFYTKFAVRTLEHWDKKNNQLMPNAPDAARINEELNQIRITVIEAIDAGMSENQIRDLMGVGPVKAMKTRGPRKDKGEMRVETAKKTLVNNGYKHRITTPAPEEEPVPEPARPLPEGILHPDPETATLLARFGAKPLPADQSLAPSQAATPPAPVEPERELTPALQVVPANDYYIVVDEPQLVSEHYFSQSRMNDEEAQRYATVQALSTQRPQYVFHCKPVARVHVAVQIDQL